MCHKPTFAVIIQLLLISIPALSFQPILTYVHRGVVYECRRAIGGNFRKLNGTSLSASRTGRPSDSEIEKTLVMKAKRENQSTSFSTKKIKEYSSRRNSDVIRRKKVISALEKTNPSDFETWRIYGISVHPDALEQKEKVNISTPASLSPEIPQALKDVLKSKLRLPSAIDTFMFKIVRRSLDARKKLKHPVYNYVVDMSLPASERVSLGWREQSGRIERLYSTNETSSFNDDVSEQDGKIKRTVVIVGMGPAGLFCALQLALKSNNTIRTILLDRGQPVEKRGRDIGALMHRRFLDSESNFAFGEGGAGTWSDGKLTTRIGRNSDTVRMVLEKLVEFGAPASILSEGAPHLGTENLVKLLRNMRRKLVELGGEIHFGMKMTDLRMKDGSVCGIVANSVDGGKHRFEGDAYVLATGHSARDVYESLHDAGVQLEPKGFAVGFRIEHPQCLINMIQYGNEWGACVKTGKGKTDARNADYFGIEPQHVGMPVPSYRLATDQARDGRGALRGMYSFCMCPGGQIVPSSTDPKEMCVNGMSFSKRDSPWANSALVVSVSPEDEVLEEYRTKYGVLAGLEFQRDMERRASKLGGGNLTVPVQRMTDFCVGRVSATVPTSSYRLGVKSAPCHELYPETITESLRDALTNHFSKQMPGYLHPDGLLHAVETRTSSPLRISRDPNTLIAVGTDNLFPIGEGAGFAGGIVSAAVDGVNVAESILDCLCGESRPNRIQKEKPLGFSY